MNGFVRKGCVQLKISFSGSCHAADMRGGGYASCRRTGGQVWRNVMCGPRVDGLGHFPFAAGDALGNINNIKSRYKQRAADTLHSSPSLLNCKIH